MLSAVIKK